MPDVVTRLSREKVMVSDFVHGVGFDAVKETDQATRDRVGEILFRFYFGCMYRHGQFSGDPHPGNFLLLGDGRVAFLDFGLFKVMPRHLLELELECQRAGHEGDAQRLYEIFVEGGLLKQPERFRPDKVLSQFLDATWWYLTDEEIELVPEIATQVMIDMSDPRSEHFGQMRHETLPADHIFGRRVEMLTLAVLGQMRARANWHRIAREWIYGDEPVHRTGPRRGRVLPLVQARGELAGRDGVHDLLDLFLFRACRRSGSASQVTSIRPVCPSRRRRGRGRRSRRPPPSRGVRGRTTRGGPRSALPPHGHVRSWCSLALQTARMFLPEASTLTSPRVP